MDRHPVCSLCLNPRTINRADSTKSAERIVTVIVTIILHSPVVNSISYSSVCSIILATLDKNAHSLARFIVCFLKTEERSLSPRPTRRKVSIAIEIESVRSIGRYKCFEVRYMDQSWLLFSCFGAYAESDGPHPKILLFTR